MSKTMEADFHNRTLVNDFIAKPENQGGLGWTQSVNSKVSENGLLHEESLFKFLKHGCQQNETSWAIIKKQYGENKGEQVLKQGVLDLIENVTNILQVFKRSFKIDGLDFTLFNRPPRRGSLASSYDNFSKNEFVTIAEVTIKHTLSFGNENKRPDQLFYLNGILYSFLEVKAMQTGQTAKKNGVIKISADFRSFAIPALWEARCGFERETGSTWKGWESQRTSDFYRKKVLNCSPVYFKTAWFGAIDMSNIYLAPSVNAWLKLCDAEISDYLKGADIQSTNTLKSTNEIIGLNQTMESLCPQMPPVQHKDTMWEANKEHLIGLLSKHGVAREIDFWGDTTHEKHKSSKIKNTLITPRAPQRVSMQQIMNYVNYYYANEEDPNWYENELRKKIATSMSVLSPHEVDKIIENRKRFKNGNEIYSILIQGAAGLGKTNIAVWTAIELYLMLQPIKKTQAPNSVREPLFDRVVILTDRVELRDNIAEEAERASGTRSQILAVEDRDTLIAALTGEPLKSNKTNSGIIVVNLQKFPSLRNDIQSGELRLKKSVGRTAFIIDEVHRSQNGELNEAAIQPFIDDVTALASSTGEGKTKNLIIGLTATPSDAILSRFGMWRAGVSMSDNANWVPHYAYTINQAIKDGYTLNPLNSYVKFSIIYKINEAATEANLNGKNISKLNKRFNNLYENIDRQRKVAEFHARNFVTHTMLAIKDKNSNFHVGRGKSMITVPSIEAAISMQKLIKEELAKLANNSYGMPWQKYADVVGDVAENRVFVLFSKSIQQGKVSYDCSHYNKINGMSFPTEKQIIDAFRCVGAGSNHNQRNSIIVVVDKLLTGFDEPTLHTFHIDRSLTGIALLQAMCRVNRVVENKFNCVILDTCIDETVTREARLAFEKYGGVSTVNFNGIDMSEEIKRLRKWLYKDKMLVNYYNKERKDPDIFYESRQELVNKKMNKPLVAEELRASIASYLARVKYLKPLMYLDSVERNHKWIDFLEEIKKSLNTCLKDNGETDFLNFVYEIEDGIIDLDSEMVLNNLIRENSDCQKTIKNSKPNSINHEIIDIFEQLEGIFLEQEERTMLLRESNEFIQNLFNRIDESSKNDNNDSFRKILYSSDKNIVMDYSKTLDDFKHLFYTATSRAYVKTDREKQLKKAAAKIMDSLLSEYMNRPSPYH